MKYQRKTVIVLKRKDVITYNYDFELFLHLLGNNVLSTFGIPIYGIGDKEYFRFYNSNIHKTRDQILAHKKSVGCVVELSVRMNPCVKKGWYWHRKGLNVIYSQLIGKRQLFSYLAIRNKENTITPKRLEKVQV